jgi:ankyrin repeat protein
VYGDDEHTFQLLLEAGANVEAEDLASWTPLTYAAAAVALDTGQLLVSRVRTDSPTGSYLFGS